MTHRVATVPVGLNSPETLSNNWHPSAAERWSVRNTGQGQCSLGSVPCTGRRHACTCRPRHHHAIVPCVLRRAACWSRLLYHKCCGRRDPAAEGHAYVQSIRVQGGCRCSHHGTARCSSCRCMAHMSRFIVVHGHHPPPRSHAAHSTAPLHPACHRRRRHGPWQAEAGGCTSFPGSPRIRRQLSTGPSIPQGGSPQPCSLLVNGDLDGLNDRRARCVSRPDSDSAAAWGRGCVCIVWWCPHGDGGIHWPLLP